VIHWTAFVSSAAEVLDPPYLSSTVVTPATVFSTAPTGSGDESTVIVNGLGQCLMVVPANRTIGPAVGDTISTAAGDVCTLSSDARFRFEAACYFQDTGVNRYQIRSMHSPASQLCASVGRTARGASLLKLAPCNSMDTMQHFDMRDAITAFDQVYPSPIFYPC